MVSWSPLSIQGCPTDDAVLQHSMVGEFLSASVGGPFLFFMLEDLGVPGGGGESAIGFWAGIVCKCQTYNVQQWRSAN